MIPGFDMEKISGTTEALATSSFSTEGLNEDHIGSR